MVDAQEAARDILETDRSSREVMRRKVESVSTLDSGGADDEDEDDDRELH